MEFRREDRAEVEATCKIRYGAGIARYIVVENVTAYGCGLRSEALRFQVGDLLSLRIDDIGPIEAIIRWISPRKGAGVEFLRPLHPAVLDHLVKATSKSARRAASKSPPANGPSFHELKIQLRSV